MTMPCVENNYCRRNFLRAAGICFGYSIIGSPFSLFDGIISPIANATAGNKLPVYPAQFYDKLADLEIQCQLCPRSCVVGEGERGYCGVRENRSGEYYSLIYGSPCSMNIDPIEKKPFFHFMPGTKAFSIAAVGCNLDCKFCQNWQISQARPEDVKSMKFTPEEIASATTKYGCQTIAYTYSEPTVNYEYILDCAIAGEKQGLKSAMVSSGFIRPDPMKNLLPHLSAVKVDLKAFSQKYYSEICRGELQPVLDTLMLLKKSGVWLEIVNLMVPTLNDDPAEIRELCTWIHTNLGPDVPIHFTRFHPEYLLKNLPSTPVASLERAYTIAKEVDLNFPYIGNVYGHDWENTYCPGCGSEIIKRSGFQISSFQLESGRCKKCGRTIPGIWA